MQHLKHGMLALLLSPMINSALAAESSVWPGESWATASPQSQQLDSAPLDQLDMEIQAGKHGFVDDMLIIRNGYLVYEKSYQHDYVIAAAGRDSPGGIYNYYDTVWHPWYKGGKLHTMQSISKSVTSALVGIAVLRGEIPDVDISIAPYFTDFNAPPHDARRDAITLRDLMTMTAGIKWDENSAYTNPENSCAAMEASADWVQYVLDQPMLGEPGERFEYNSGITMLIAQLLFKATGEHAQDYAKKHLFGPLGIREFYWKTTPGGLNDAEGGLYLKPADLAKFGYLYLHDGQWNGQRILPQGWVEASMKPAVLDTGSPERYGFQWWLLPYEGGKQGWAYFGSGYGGQYLFIVPEYDLVAVITGWNIYGEPSLWPGYALNQIVKSIKDRGN